MKRLTLNLQSLLDRWVCFVTLLFLLTEVTGGVLRYTLSGAGLSALVYIPKLLLVVMLGLLTFTGVARGRLNGLHLFTFAFCSLFTAVGLFYTNSPLQVGFGLWILLPLIFGVVSYPALRRTWARLNLPLSWLWLTAVVGVFLDSVYTFPWVGFNYEVQGVTVEGARQWSTFGVARLGGFAQASFSAANQILLLGSFVVMTSNRWGWRLVVWSASGAAIYLTTTKSILGVFIVLSLFLALERFVPRSVWRLLPTAIMIVGVALPLSTLLINYALDLNSRLSQVFLFSFDARLTDTWPQTFELIAQQGNVLLGRGIGGIGTPQRYFEPLSELSSPGDNLFLYLYALVGITVLPVMLSYALSATRLELRNRLDSFFFTAILSILLLGITSNVLESGIFSLFFGLSLRHVLAPKWHLRPRHTHLKLPEAT